MNEIKSKYRGNEIDFTLYCSMLQNKYFWKYKDDVKAANDLLSKGDKEALLNLCDKQVTHLVLCFDLAYQFKFCLRCFRLGGERFGNVEQQR